MDPITAISNAIAQMFAFLATPAGQKVVLDVAAANQKINEDIAGLIAHLREQAQKQGA